MAIRTKPKVLSLCSGIGAFDYGISMAFGSETVCYVEREAYATSVLVARMEAQTLHKAPIWDSLKSFDGKPWRGKVDIVAVAVPCQPVSVAGRGRQSRDPRWLWDDALQVIKDVHPAVVVLENVRGLVSRGLRQIVESLDRCGYDAVWSIYRVDLHAGGSHQRERLFLIAYARENAVGYTYLKGLEGRNESIDGSAYEWPSWPPRPEGDWASIPKRYWPATEPELRRVANARKSTHWVDRLRALGNAVCPWQAKFALNDLVSIIRENYE